MRVIFSKTYKFALSLLMVLLLNVTILSACDDSYASITAVTDLGGGITRYTFELCPEYNGPEGSPLGFGFEFSPGTVSVVAFTPPTVSTSNSDVYTGAISGSDVFWNFPGPLPTHSSTNLCFTGTVDVTGTVTAIVAVTHEGNPDDDCNQSIPFVCLASSTLVWD